MGVILVDARQMTALVTVLGVCCPNVGYRRQNSCSFPSSRWHEFTKDVCWEVWSTYFCMLLNHSLFFICMIAWNSTIMQYSWLKWQSAPYLHMDLGIFLLILWVINLCVECVNWVEWLITNRERSFLTDICVCISCISGFYQHCVFYVCISLLMCIYLTSFKGYAVIILHLNMNCLCFCDTVWQVYMWTLSSLIPQGKRNSLIILSYIFNFLNPAYVFNKPSHSCLQQQLIS